MNTNKLFSPEWVQSWKALKHWLAIARTPDVATSVRLKPVVKKPTVQILVGLQGSGKSTYAETIERNFPSWAVISYDRLRHYDSQGHPQAYEFSKKREHEIKQVALQLATKAIRSGQSIIIDNTNLTDYARQFWFDFADQHGAQAEIREFTTSLDECVTRNAYRTGWQRVPRAVIERAALFTGRVQFPIGQRVVLVDIDGTLADSSRRQKFVNGVCLKCQGIGKTKRSAVCRYCKGAGTAKKDWKSFYAHITHDDPRKPIAQWVRQLADSGLYYICIVSGRPLDQCGEGTVDWLAHHAIPYDRIFMRNARDYREDTIVKKEILDQITKQTNVEFTIDDRPRVIRMWQDNGIAVYDVGDGVEF